MTKDLRNAFVNVMDFYFVEAPYVCTAPVEQIFKLKGFKPPFKTWFEYIGDQSNLDDKGTEYGIYKGEESFKLIFKFIEENGPFDGALSFSQGSAIFRTMYGLRKVIEKGKARDL